MFRPYHRSRPMPDRYDHNLLIQSLRNLHPKSASLLAKTRNSMLKKKGFGAVTVYLRATHGAPRNVILNRLWALQGALMDMDWRVLPSELQSKIRAKLSDVNRIS